MMIRDWKLDTSFFFRFRLKREIVENEKEKSKEAGEFGVKVRGLNNVSIGPSSSLVGEIERERVLKEEGKLLLHTWRP